MTPSSLFRLLLLLSFPAFLFLGAACSPKSADNDSVDDEPEYTQEEMEAERERIRMQDLANMVKKSRKLVAANRPDVETVIEQLKVLEINVRGTKYEKDATQLIAQEKRRLEQFAADELKRIMPAVDKLMDDKDYRAAEDELYNLYDWQRFAELPATKDYEKKRDSIRIFIEAEMSADEVLPLAAKFKRQGEVAKAIAVLESFSDRYTETTFYPEVRQTIEDYMAVYLEEKEAEEELLSIAWVDLALDELVPRGGDDDDSVFRIIGGAYEVDNSTEGAAQLVGGEHNWIEWYLEFDAKVPSGKKLNLGVRSRLDYRTNTRQYESFGFELPTDDWIKLRVEVREGHCKLIQVFEDQVDLIADPVRLSNPTGGFAFNFRPGDSLALRNLRYKVFSQEEGLDDDEG